ncbi:MAG: hypothetical protein M4579_003105 [Chaenotheca gracillima]|nr:MAG: hypothetical protein M4579_003105 [Chaenotheca gracillima]
MPETPPPIHLATELLRVEEQAEIGWSRETSTVKPAGKGLEGAVKGTGTGTGQKGIDDQALRGRGFDVGRIVAVSGRGGVGKTAIALHTIVTHLLTHKESHAAIIDTTNSFSPVRLRDVVVARLRRRAAWERAGIQPQKRDSEDEEQEWEAEAMALLDRVSVMKAFDLVGVKEAVDELRDSMEGAQGAGGRDQSNSPGVQEGDFAEEKTMEVADSEEEDEMELDHSPSQKSQELHRSPEKGIPNSKIGVIVIDQITNVVWSVMGRSQVQGHALLTTFMRSLSLLTARHSLITMLLNSAAQTKSQSLQSRRTARDDEDVSNDDPPLRNSNTYKSSQSISIFASTSGKPALGALFLSCADMHVFLSRVPRTREDAEKALGRGEHPRHTTESAPSWREVGVFEVLLDRHGDRLGGWGTFDIDGIDLR